ncbi:MAG: MFS transporter [Sneathiella sp.]|uniref:MFS transporter n=1 Tax=Sneathiella sp. TaxID=1964365 RepID=UPI000C639B36|nr:MFS transporter [Sneathiella sp.]MAL78949.1 MFS transporter [Sneathiella sp.]
MAISITGSRLTLALCIAEITAMSSFATFPAMTPFFFSHWSLSGEDAGWINAAFFFGFTMVGPVMTSMTDRIDARRVFLTGCGMAIIGAYGFAYLAHDFSSALPWRFLSGAGLGCTYMPGLKLLTDRLPPGDQSRAIAFYTASFSTGSAVSFLLVGQVHLWLGWEAAMISVIIGPPVSIAIILLATSPKSLTAPRPWSQIFNYAPVLTNRFSMGYIIAYICHTWELVTMRSFLLAFLVYAHTLTEAPAWMDVATITALAVFVGLPSSVLGNELSLKIGRQRAITLVMIFCLLFSFSIGFTANLPFVFVVAMALVYGFMITADSSSITAGAVGSAPTELRGATMAVHSFLGFGGGMIGPVVAGIVLDRSGGTESTTAWGLMFISMGAITLVGPLALRLTRK